MKQKVLEKEKMKSKVALAIAVVMVISALSAGFASAAPEANISDRTFNKVTIEGASFAVPDTLKDDVSSYKKEVEEKIQILPVDVPTGAFILANDSSVYLVLADHSDKGEATVNGWKIGNVTLAGVNVGVIVADDVSINKEGTPVTIQELVNNPSEYRLELVKVNATRRHVSVLFDPDKGRDVEFPITVGYLTEDPVTIQSLVRSGIQVGENLSKNPNRTVIREILKPGDERISVFDFETKYWVNCSAETNGIVLTPGSKVLELLRNATPEKAQDLLQTDRPILYDVKTNLSYIEVFSVDELKENLDQYAGKVVGFNAKGFGGMISVQESIEHNTPCGEDRVPVSTPSGTVCVNIPFDVLLEGGVAWNNVKLEQFRDTIIATAGVSSKHQDKPYDNYVGRYNYIGRVVSLHQINKSLEGTGLVVYKRDKVADINYEELAEKVRNKINETVAKLNGPLTGFTNRTISEVPISIFDTGKPDNPYPSISGTHTGTITPSSDITVSKLYTYPCAGTGGHTERVRIWGNGVDASGTWAGYSEDWHNITLNKTLTLEAGETYNYEIRTGSYPQIIHATSKSVTGGTITCTKFIDANGKEYTDWIPAIKLE